MARGITKSKEQLSPDPRYNDLVLTQFINVVMQHGKKTIARRLVYDALNKIEQRTEGEPTAIEVFHQALDNAKPNVEVRSKRVGGANYQVPMQVTSRRAQSLAFRWIVGAARAAKGEPMSESLGREIFDAYHGEGKAVTARDQSHRMAEANKAFAHFAR